MAEKKRPTLSDLLKKFAEAGEAPELSEEELDKYYHEAKKY